MKDLIYSDFDFSPNLLVNHFIVWYYIQLNQYFMEAQITKEMSSWLLDFSLFLHGDYCCHSDWAWSERARQLSNRLRITLWGLQSLFFTKCMELWSAVRSKAQGNSVVMIYVLPSTTPASVLKRFQPQNTMVNFAIFTVAQEKCCGDTCDQNVHLWPWRWQC